MPRKPNLPCAACGKLLWSSTTSLPPGQATCQPCRRASPSKPRAGICPECGGSKTTDGPFPCRQCTAKPRLRDCEVCGATYKVHRPGEAKRTCGRACGAWLLRQHPVAWPSSPIVVHQCSECFTWMSRPTRVVCSAECGMARNRRRFRLAFVSNAKPTTVPCADCGESWTTATAKNGGVCKRCQRARSKRAMRKRYGSDHRSRARHFGVRYEPIDRLKVYARDRWMCGICGERVCRTAAYPDPMSASLDHIVPLSRGGDHLYTNVQCAHFLCNSVKGANEPEHQQLALIG